MINPTIDTSRTLIPNPSDYEDMQTYNKLGLFRIKPNDPTEERFLIRSADFSTNNDKSYLEARKNLEEERSRWIHNTNGEYVGSKFEIHGYDVHKWAMGA